MLSREDRILKKLLKERGVPSPDQDFITAAREKCSVNELAPGSGSNSDSLAGDVQPPVEPSPPPPETIGGFSIVRELGRGGMGIVYEAVQPGLARHVALKVLSRGRQPTALQEERFGREARAVARLRHPNIVTIHSIGQSAELSYFAMDLIAGGSLEPRLCSGPSDPEWCARIALGIADALQAAHAAGLVHRDVKPSNILLDSDGTPKLSDFGLVYDESASRVTLDASVLGTPAFMSPEQARGEPPRPQHDVYSLVAVLYSLLAGRSPHDGDQPSVVLGQVLNGRPVPISDLQPSTPHGLTAIVSRGLSEAPGDRYRTAAELADDLRRFLAGLRTTAEYLQARRRRARAGITLAVAAAAVVMVAGLVHVVRKPVPQSTGGGFVAFQSTLKLKRITAGPGVEASPSLSPDGGKLVYCSEEDGDWDLYLDVVGVGNAENLTPESRYSDTQPAFSPDGGRIAFRSERDGGGVFILDLGTRRTRRASSFGFHPSWSPDGRRLAVSTESVSGVGRAARNFASEIWVVDVDSGNTEKVITADAIQAAWSPSGSRLSFWGRRNERVSLWTARADGSDIRECPAGGDSPRDPTWFADGSVLVFASRRTGVSDLWAVAVDEASGTCADDAQGILQSAVETHQSPNFSRDGRSLAVVNWTRGENAVRLAREGKATVRVTPITKDTRVESSPDLSPDGSWLVLSVQDGPSDLVALRTDSTGRRNLTQDSFEERTPRWSPDGEWIAFASNRTGKFEVWRMHPDGGAVERLTETAGGSALSPVWSPDGSRIVYGVRGQGILEIDPAAPAPRTARVVLAADKLEDPDSVPRAWSPDGRRLLVVDRDRNATIVELDSGEQVPVPGKTQGGAWTAEGHLWVIGGAELRLIDSKSGESRVLASVAPRKFSGALSIDRRTGDAYTTIVENEADIWLLDLTGSGAVGAPKAAGR